MREITKLPSTGQASTRYDWPTIALHWITALLLISQFATAKIWPMFEGNDLETDLFNIHMTFGILLSIVIVLRLVWRIWFGNTQPVPLQPLHHIAARAVHGILYVLLIVQVVMGYLIGWASGQPISFAGVPAIPAFVVLSRENGRMLEELHGDVAWILIAVAGLHAIAALFHHFVIRDGVLSSMIGFGSRRSS